MLGSLLYQSLWSCCRPLIRGLLAYRVRRGKEEKSRLAERYGRTSCQPFEASPLWIHGASVGEITAGLSLAQWIRTQRPDLPLLITTITRTGAQYVASHLLPQSVHQYIPLDDKPLVTSFLNTWHPRAALFVESEFWPHTLRCLHEKGIPSLSMDSHLSEKSYRWWRWGRYLLPDVFPTLTRGYVSSEAQKSFFQTLGVPDLRLIPPLKFSNALLPYQEETLQNWQQSLAGRCVWLAASTHEGEEAWVLDVHQELKKHRPGTLLIWAPRHMHRLPAIRELLQKRHILFQQYSQNAPLASATECMLVDRLGLLGLFYRLCPVAFVGGSLVPHVGGHNIIEPLQVGCIPLHGPFMRHAPQVVDLCIREGLDLQVRTPQEATTFLIRIDTDPVYRTSYQARATQLCHAQKEKVFESLQTLFEFL